MPSLHLSSLEQVKEAISPSHSSPDFHEIEPTTNPSSPSSSADLTTYIPPTLIFDIMSHQSVQTPSSIHKPITPSSIHNQVTTPSSFHVTDSQNSQMMTPSELQ